MNKSKEKELVKLVARPVPLSRKSIFGSVFAVGLLTGAGIMFALGHKNDDSSGQRVLPDDKMVNPAETEITLGGLVDMREEKLATMDIAALNLICSEGLPGRNKMPAAEQLRKIDQMAEAVRRETMHNYHQFLEKPQEFEHSEPFYRVLVLNSVLGKDFGLHYNPAKIAPATMETLQDHSFYENADDVFISGLLGNNHMGTCSSMPVVCVAVGRRLGYPLKLVVAKAHLFFRWEDGKERRNFDCTNGISSSPDSYYQQWPFPVSDDEVKRGWYLRSLTPREELATFLAARGAVLRFHGRITEALLAQTQACLLHPDHPDLQTALAMTISRQVGEVGGRSVEQSATPNSSDPFAEVRRIEAINADNQARMQQQPPMPVNPVFAR